MKKVVYSLVVLMLVVGLVAGCAAPAPAPTPAPAPKPTPTPTPAPAPKGEPIVFKAVSFQPGRESTMQPFMRLIDTVNERAKGELVIEYVGGPEAYNLREQAIAVKDGIFDMCIAGSGFYRALVPGVQAVMLTELTPEEERESGFYDFLNELHNKSGLFYLGRGCPASTLGIQFSIYTNKKVETPYDLAGQKMAPSTITPYFAKALGIVMVPISTPDFYTALERGVLDGILYPIHAVTFKRWHEVFKYIIDHQFLTGNLLNLVNLERWNSLPPHLQDLMIEAQRETLEWGSPFLLEERVKVRQELVDHGNEFIKFSPADEKWFYKTAYKSGWDDMMKKFPEIMPKYKELLTK